MFIGNTSTCVIYDAIYRPAADAVLESFIIRQSRGQAGGVEGYTSYSTHIFATDSLHTKCVVGVVEEV